MFACFVCALLDFCAQEFYEKSIAREPGEIIVECTSYASINVNPWEEAVINMEEIGPRHPMQTHVTS